MNPGQPSRTAIRVALRRAAHQVLDSPLVFEDPLAMAMIGRERAAAMRADPSQFESQLGSSILRAFLVVRSRIAEDALTTAVGRGVRQYVVLGAGMDTYAYRHNVTGLQVFEVDQPSTQAFKRTRLADAGIDEPASLRFVPVDFEQQSFADELTRAGFDATLPAFFSWLGVTPYLTEAAAWTTLRTVAALAKTGGGITFDYAVPPESLGFVQRARFEVLARRVAAIGEPFQTFFDPDELRHKLLELGFDTVDDLGPEALNAAYFANRTDKLSVGGMGHIVTAWAA
jgi:methyltransferase (TIGR00027 family)